MDKDLLITCRELIREGKTRKVLDILSEFCSDREHPALNDVLLLSSQYNKFKKDVALGLISEATTENRISMAILDILNSLESKQAKVIPSRKSRFYVFVAIGIIVFGVLLKLILGIGSNVSGTQGDQSPVIHGDHNRLEFNNNTQVNEKQ
jgi:hypothetical protein